MGEYQPMENPAKDAASNLDFILDIPLEVTVRLGRARLPISDLLELGAVRSSSSIASRGSRSMCSSTTSSWPAARPS